MIYYIIHIYYSIICSLLYSNYNAYPNFTIITDFMHGVGL